MQNELEGLALVDPGGTVLEFLSHEGTITAADGAALGMLSVNIGVSESGSTPVDQSLQLTGTGIQNTDFTWSGPSARSYGNINSGQTFSASGAGGSGTTASPPPPPPPKPPPAPSPTSTFPPSSIFINEIHYDNTGTAHGSNRRPLLTATQLLLTAADYCSLLLTAAA